MVRVIDNMLEIKLCFGLGTVAGSEAAAPCQTAGVSA